MTEFEDRSADWLSVGEALERVLAFAEPLPHETVPLADALGVALAAPISARATLPPWDNSAMDGYAVRAADVRQATAEQPVRLAVLGSARAGAAAGTAVSPGGAVRIMTGAPVPAGADSVIRVEDTDREAGSAGTVEVRSDRDAHRNVRPGGQDMRAGDVVLRRGTTMGAGHIAVAAAAGHGRVEAHRRPRVAILSNGDELRTLDEWDDVAGGSGVPETNGLTLAAAARAAGAIPLPPRLALDTPGSIEEHLLASRAADVLITSGGASMGEADLLKRVLDGLGFELDFWRVTLRPGSPLSFGRLPRPDAPPMPVFGLPGNPASAFVTFELFARPFLLKLAGHRRIHRLVVGAAAGEPLHSSAGLSHFHRVTLERAGSGVPRAYLAGPQGSGLVRTLGRADGLAVVFRGVERIERDEAVEVILLNDGPAASERPGYGPES